MGANLFNQAVKVVTVTYLPLVFFVLGLRFTTEIYNTWEFTYIEHLVI
jgi:hypothetical protein